MLSFVLRRLVGVAVMLVVVITGMFALLHLSPVSPVSSLPPAVAADPAARAAVEERLGLDQPLLVQYRDYMGGLLRGDMGTSLYDGSSVADQIAAALPASLELGSLAALFALIPGLALGAWAARRHGRAVDGGARVLTVIALSVPSYWLAVVCLVVVGERFPDLLPNAGGFTPFSEDPIANLQVMLLPAVVLGLPTFALVARSLRSSLIEVLSFDYVTFARANGMAERSIMRRIALRNAFIPTLTIMGMLIGGLVAGTVLVENVFQLPGLGQLLVTAFVRQDYPLALGACITTATIFLLLNLVVDVLHVLVDPRIARPTLPTEGALA